VTAARSRIPALDALRGVAVAGIVPMNVIAFAMPAAAYINPRAFGGTGAADTAAWALSFLLVEDKFRALFAMLFGAGIVILAERGTLRAHYARMAALAAIALAHAVLLANNDVLRSYAVAGLVLPLALRWRVRSLLLGASALMAGQLLVSGYAAWGWLRYWHEYVSGLPVDPAPLAETERRFGADAQVIAASIAQAQESFGERLVRRTGDWQVQALAVLAALPSTLAAMLVGAALWRNGLLAGEWPAARAVRLARTCAMLTIPLLLAMAVWSWASGFDAIVTAFNALVLSAPFDLLLGVGYAALAMATLSRAKRWAAVGRMALTNYLATSLIFAALFAAWGLGLFGEVGRVEALALGLIPISAMLLWSPAWLARFRQGPAEWLWRSLAAGRALPLSR
jgi:uncharacterized protein